MILPAEITRCAANGLWPGGNSRPQWCEERDACARYVAIASDPMDGTTIVHPRLCAAGEFDHGISFKAVDCQSQATTTQYSSRPKPGEPHGWYVPFQPCGRFPEISNPAQEANP